MTTPANRAIAIVGVSAILPDAPDAQTAWQNIKDAKYSITDIPEGRWDPELYYDPDPSVPDKTYSKLGGWVRDWEWDPMKWKLPIPPKVSDAMDEAQKWAVACARSAMMDYGWPDRPIDNDRTAIVVGTAMAGDKHYITALRIFFPEYARALSQVGAFSELPKASQDVITRELYERIAEATPENTEDTMPGELANCMPGRIANLFDLHGPNYVCDAACASALAALDAAVEGLHEDEYDAVLVGGVDRNMGPSPFVKFSKIGALSATGTRPYADGSDGFVMAEGAAFFLLKRLADAEKAGDKIYAVVRGVGGSSDGKGKGITAPNPTGQRLAIERAWRSAGLSPGTAGLVEGHGTSTRVGDVVEVDTLSGVFGESDPLPRSIPLGSVKSNFGHLKGAAGAAGLLKAVFSVHEGVLPASLHFDKPNPNIDWDRSPFYVNSETKPWEETKDGARRAGVSAFGFGGTNFHAVIEQHVPGMLTSNGGDTTVSVPRSFSGGNGGSGASLKAPLRGAVVLGGASASELRDKLSPIVERAKGGQTPNPEPPAEADLRAPERIAIDFGDAKELAAKGERALKALESDQAAMWKALKPQGVFRGSGEPGKIAFLYTGQGSQYANMLAGLRKSEPVVAELFDEADAVMSKLIDKPLSEYIFTDPEDKEAIKKCEADLRRTEITQPAVLTVDAALTRMLAAYGIQPDMVMGHSLGEYGALVAAGSLPFNEALEAVSARGSEMAHLSVEDNGKMAAVFAPLEEIEKICESVDGYVVVANLNSRSQAVVGGASEAVDKAMEIFVEREFQAIPIPVSHAFHSSIVAPVSEPLRATLQRLHLQAPSIPLVANVNGEFYPVGPNAHEKMLDILAEQVASPVQFVKGLETLYEAGARVFVEVGPKKALHGFVEDVLGDREGVVALFTNHPKSGDAASLNQALCGIYAAGIGLGSVPEVAEPKPAASPAQALPVQSVQQRLAAAQARTPAPAAGTETYLELGKLFAEFLDRGREIYEGPSTTAPAPTRPKVVTGAALGLPGTAQVFDDLNIQRILDGGQGIDLIPTRFRHAMVDKNITRLVKSDGGDPHFETIEGSEDVIKLAARGGDLDLTKEYGVSAERVEALDICTQLAMAAGIDALRDAGIPLVMHYKTTTKGTKLPERWMLPDDLRDDTAIIFASALPGFDSFANELTQYFEAHARETALAELESLRARLDESGEHAQTLHDEIDRRIHEVKQSIEHEPYTFDRRFLFRCLPMGHSQFAEYIGARGPNTHINAACASTTQAFAVAEDWINAGRCKRAVVIAADDVTSDHLIEWVGSGFLASGAAATDDVVEKAALPFDRRRHGMIMGMGAAAVVIEDAAGAAERGLRPICEILSTTTANSAFHGTRLDVEHISGIMEETISNAEKRYGIDRHRIARELVFVSHETYTPARGGSASAEIHSLRKVFGDDADSIVIANTKGLTGHPMGVGIEDVVAVKALETGVIPPVANFAEPDPELGNLHLSRGGFYPVRYALRLGAGFGSQISMSLLRLVEAPDGKRPNTDELGYRTRVTDQSAWANWLARLSGESSAQVEVVDRTLRVVDTGPAAGMSRVSPPSQAAQPAKPAATVEATAPPEAASAAGAASSAAKPAGTDDAIKERVLAIVAEKTGYPTDMLDLDLDLEADLGIDTVKQAETFAAIREAYNIPRDENLKLRDYPTLAHAIGFVKERCPDLAAIHGNGATAVSAETTSVTPPPAETAAPESAAAASAPGSDDEAIKATVLQIVCEKTGYPSDMLDLDLDLEADLGIDTVKQAETFAAIREAYGIPRDENLKLRDYPTLAHAIQFVKERRTDQPAAAGGTQTAAATQPAPETGNGKDTAPSATAGDDDEQIKQKVLEIVCEKTGYPPDMLDLDLDLEADLGIDTVKQAETFAAIREAYGIPRDENLKLRDYPTLAHAIGFVKERRTDKPAGATAQPAGDGQPAAAEAGNGKDAAPSATAGDDDEQIKQKVLEIVCEKTGYPPDMLDLDLDLEADLGIDTVKQAETFAAIREAYGIPRDENLKLRDYPTLAHAIGFVKERRTDKAGATAPASGDAQPAAATTAAAEVIKGSLEAAARIPRRVPKAVLRPALEQCKPSGVHLGPDSRVVVMLDGGGVGKALVKRLDKLGVTTLVIDDVPSREELADRLQKWAEEGPIQGLYWLPALESEGNHSDLDLDGWRNGLELRVKLLYTAARALYEQFDKEGTFLVSATRLGGRHGYEDSGATSPMGGAVVGFTKAFKRERPASIVKAVDFPATRKTAELADALIAEATTDPGATEIGIVDGKRWTVALVEEDLDDANPGMELGADTVYVVTGAAGSIVSAITADLASADGGSFHLLDLTPEPDPDDADIRRFTEDRDALKLEIFERIKAAGERATPAMVEKQLASLERAHAALEAIEAVRAAGGTAHYHSVDLKDAAGVRSVIEKVREQSGKIDVLLHAAGLERSRRLPDKEPSEFDLIFDVKADGWFNLMSAAGDMPIASTVCFSSIAGRFGNAGQSDYSSANDLLCKCTSNLRSTRGQTRGIVIDWTAWGGIGMATRGSIPEVMKAVGIDMLDPEAGIAMIRHELTGGGRRGEILVAERLGVLLEEFDDEGGLDRSRVDTSVRGPMTGEVVAMGVNDGLHVRTRLDPAKQPFLHDHQIDDTPVLPGVMGIEGFCEAAGLLLPEWTAVSIEDVRFLAPFKFYRNEPREVDLYTQLTSDGQEIVAHCRLVGSRMVKGSDAPRVTTHFTAKVRMTLEVPAEQKADAPPADGEGVGATDVYRVYFHGPAYQVLDKAWRHGDGVVGRLAQELPANHDPGDAPLTACPRLIELCFQAAGVWQIGKTGRMGLPSRIARVALPPRKADGDLFAVVSAANGDERYDAVVVDGSGRVQVALEGYETATLPSELPSEERAPLAAAVSVEA